MQFQQTTDYAIRILGYMSANEQIVRVWELEEQLKISGNYMRKVLRELVNNNIIASIRGKNGGYYLARPADQISVYDVVLAIEKEFVIIRCLYDDSYCSCYLPDECPAREVFKNLQADLVAKLRSITMADLWVAPQDFYAKANPGG